MAKDGPSTVIQITMVSNGWLAVCAHVPSAKTEADTSSMIAGTLEQLMVLVNEWERGLYAN